MWQAIDLTGQRFGHLLVIHGSGERSKCGGAMWKCQCDCGNEVLVRAGSLASGNTKSCGCLRIERVKECNTIHGLRGTRLYHVWDSMKQRCLNQNDRHFNDYGGRGLTICDDWLNVQQFYAWAMANGYKQGLSIDRINNDGNYEPANCRWVTQAEQTPNTRRNKIVGGVCLAEYCRIHGVSYRVVKNMLQTLGQTIDPRQLGELT